MRIRLLLQLRKNLRLDVIREGAFDYLPKPFTNLQLEHILEKVNTVTQLRQENRKLKYGACHRDYFAGLGAMLNLVEIAA